MHEYITSYVKPSYNECIDCNKRTIHICLKCHYCYSCHFKIESREKERERASKYHQHHDRDSVTQEEHPVSFVTYKIKPTQTSKIRGEPLFVFSSYST